LTRPPSSQSHNELPNQPQAPINNEETIKDLSGSSQNDANNPI
jgi:hypothetical protein